MAKVWAALVILDFNTSTSIAMNSEITTESRRLLVITYPPNNRLCIIIAIVKISTEVIIIPAKTVSMDLGMQIIATNATHAATMVTAEKVIGGMLMTMGHASTRSIAKNENCLVQENPQDIRKVIRYKISCSMKSHQW